jgi:beta-galactosidase
MVYGTGWDATGIWNYFASFYGHAWLWQGNGRKAAESLYAFANHAAPILAWREEQSLKGEPYKKVGDMPHNWASAEFIRLAVHLLALDRGDELHLLEGIPAVWVKPGMVTKLTEIATPFGKLTMTLEIAGDGRTANLRVEPLTGTTCRKGVVHLSGLTGGDSSQVIEFDPKTRNDLSIPITTSLRRTIPLDGAWEIAEGAMDKVPTEFERRVPVPGLADMAQPPFAEPGPKLKDPKEFPLKDPKREAFWYRRTFTLDGPVPPVATLKVAKAMFGTRVILNGTSLGDHAPCFTPGFFDAKPSLRTGGNEVLIRIGADPTAVTAAVPSGSDYEKQRYIPGIFDSVELILSDTPAIVNVRVTPDVSKRQAQVTAWLKNATAGEITVSIIEARTGRTAGVASARLTASPDQEVQLVVPVTDCHLWSPENPFLYQLVARTAGDVFTTRFGMREFRFDPTTGRAMLNGKPYYLRGSNITLYRFFEDPDRGNLPWNGEWVRLLHRRVKDMHWNSLRYCIGFPPEAWYRIADEEGILIQDEYPLWFGGKGWSTWPKPLKSNQLAAEFSEWMRERWNHPSVVIWDASNETFSGETGAAIGQVRGLDPSRRPWDNSYMPPGNPGDVFEVHPYHFINSKFRLSGLATSNPVPQDGNQHNDGGNGVIINEYGWLWLNRDGTPTTLTTELYQNLLGRDATTSRRRHLYARLLAAETEFWRTHRKAAGVLHFTALGYSRPDGQTSDHWLDVRSLTWEPEFLNHVRDAFAPVGLMIDAWEESYQPGVDLEFPVVLINDLDALWKGDVRFRILRDGKALTDQKLPGEISGLGSSKLGFTVRIPTEPGDYQAEATLLATPAGSVRSLRDFAVLQPGK